MSGSCEFFQLPLWIQTLLTSPTQDLLSTLQTVLTNVTNSWRSHLLRVAHFEAMDRNARLVLEQKMEKEAQWRKNMLLNNVSHELRTPLHTIKAALGLLADDAGHGEGDQRELLAEASQANEELTRLIDHLMVSLLGGIGGGFLEIDCVVCSGTQKPNLPQHRTPDLVNQQAQPTSPTHQVLNMKSPNR